MAKNILIQPILTEKAVRLAEEDRQYAFQVALDANKIQIREAVEARYPGVEIDSVRTMVVRGKRKRQFTRKGVMEGRRPFTKKAIVTLSSGEIDLYEAV